MSTFSLSFTLIRTLLLKYFYSALFIQLIISKGIVSTCTTLRFNFFLPFGTNVIFFPALNGNIFNKVFHLPLRALSKVSLSANFLKILFVYEVCFYGGSRYLLQYLFLFFSAVLRSTRGCRAKVWYRTRNTPARLCFDPEDSQPCKPWCQCSCLFPPG